MSTTQQSHYGKQVLNNIVQSFITQIEAGTPSWIRPYSGTGSYALPKNYATRRPYRGINILQLLNAMDNHGYESPYFISYKQASILGYHVKRGQKGHQIIYWDMKQKEGSEPNEQTGELKIYWFVRTYSVFHISQVDGLEPPQQEDIPQSTRYKQAQQFIKDTGIKIITKGGSIPSYNTKSDIITLPRLKEFTNEEEYIAAGLHELVHASGAKHRLNRLETCRFGDHKYAFEELTAELGAAFLGAHFHIALHKIQHVEYLNHWVKALQAYPSILWSASAKAQSAYDYLLKLAGQPVPFEQVAVNQ